MAQLHKRFSDEQIAFLFDAYSRGLMSRDEIQDTLKIGKTRFFVLLKQYRKNPEAFSIAYERRTIPRLSSKIEERIEIALLKEKVIVEDPDLPISGYNYSALRDRLLMEGIDVSVTTIIDRAKKLDCHKPHRKRKVHDREVLTASIGALVQHDASTHLWSPLAKEKWTLITSIDDYSRKILFADFFPAESTWAHIHASQSLILTYGLPLRYYVNCLREFGFVQGEDIFWRKHVLQTDEIDTQWRKMMRLLNVDVSYALSPQAQGDELLADVQGNNIQPTRCMQGTQMRGRARKVTRKILTSPLNRF